MHLIGMIWNQSHKCSKFEVGFTCTSLWQYIVSSPQSGEKYTQRIEFLGGFSSFFYYSNGTNIAYPLSAMFPVCFWTSSMYEIILKKVQHGFVFSRETLSLGWGQKNSMFIDYFCYMWPDLLKWVTWLPCMIFRFFCHQ